MLLKNTRLKSRIDVRNYGWRKGTMTRSEKAVDLFKQGYNCSQAVFGAFVDLYDIDSEVALMLSTSFGGGMGRMREVCGAVSGMFLVAGLETGTTDGRDTVGKQANYKIVQELAEEFTKENGSIVCRELLGLEGKLHKETTPEPRTAGYYKKRPCVELVEEAATIVEEFLKKRGKLKDLKE